MTWDDHTGLDRAIASGRDADGVLSAGTAGHAGPRRVQHVRECAAAGRCQGVAMRPGELGPGALDTRQEDVHNLEYRLNARL